VSFADADDEDDDGDDGVLVTFFGVVIYTQAHEVHG
jgi:hypothetical protein